MTDELGKRKPPITLRPWNGILRRRRNHVNPRYDAGDLTRRWSLSWAPVQNTVMQQMWREFPESDGHA